MQVHFYSPVRFEDWYWKSPDDPGIGGSETAVVETAWRLAQRGHDVIVYAPIPKGIPPEYKGSIWHHVDEADFSREGIWIISRSPDSLDYFPTKHPKQKLWLVAQDTDYVGLPGHWNEERWNKLDRFIALCPSHYNYTREKYAPWADKVCLGFNGVRVDLIDSLPPVERNLRRVFFGSSPDRGLLELLEMWPRIREWVHDAELHIAYGLDNIQKIIDSQPGTPYWRSLRDQITESAKQPGIKWLGRIGQLALYAAKASCAISVHCTSFTETGFISGLEEMALGCIPIVFPTWAAGDYCTHGVWILGNPKDPLVKARWTGDIVELLSNPAKQEAIRAEMVPYARSKFDWEVFVDLCDMWIHGNYRPATSETPKHSVVFLAYDPEGKMKAMIDQTRALALLYSKGAEFIEINMKGQELAVNEGFRRAKGEYIHFVCSDVYIHEDWLDKMADPDAVTAYDLMNFVLDGSPELALDLFTVPRKVYEKVGGWDPAYAEGYGFSDSDWLNRVRDAGFRTRAELVNAKHLGASVTFKSYNPNFQEMYDRNKEIYIKSRPVIEMTFV